MNTSPLKVYIDRLKNDETEQIFENIEPKLQEAQEEELSFTDEIIVSGQAYLANEHLILDLKVKASAKMPCSICNEKATNQIELKDFKQTVELSEIPSAVYDYGDEVRNAILLKIPQFLECNQGKCPSRKDVKKFLKESESNTHSPFSDLNL